MFYVVYLLIVDTYLCFQLQSENEDIHEADQKSRFKKSHPGRRYFAVVVLFGLLFLGYIAIAYD